MIRLCSMIALFELALLATVVGLPSAYADPADECCTDPLHGECSGCQGGYLIGQGILYGCLDVGGTGPGCTIDSMECQRIDHGIIRWRDGSNCTIFKEFSQGVVIYRDGCYPELCD